MSANYVTRAEFEALRKSVSGLAQTVAVGFAAVNAQQHAADTQANAILTDLRAIVARMEKRK